MTPDSLMREVVWTVDRPRSRVIIYRSQRAADAAQLAAMFGGLTAFRRGGRQLEVMNTHTLVEVIDGESHLATRDEHGVAIDEPRIYWPGWLRRESWLILDILNLEHESDKMLSADQADQLGAWIQDELIAISEFAARSPETMHTIGLVASKTAELRIRARTDVPDMDPCDCEIGSGFVPSRR